MKIRYRFLRHHSIRAIPFLLVAGVAFMMITWNAQAEQGKEGKPQSAPDLKAVREALGKYKDPIAAVHDGYFSTVGCIEYPDGGMGVHFLNTALMGPEPDPLRPQVLIYEPDRDQLRLVAAEWFVPLATGVKERPAIFGQPFNGPMEGHHPLMPSGLHHYDLHVWLFKENPAGMFNPTNPNVKCDATRAYNFKEEPPRLVSHPN